MANRPLAGLSLFASDDFRRAAVPLFAQSLVDVVEWSFDTCWTPPEWLVALCDAYAAQGRLFGHGVSFGLLSATLEPRQERWLDKFALETKNRAYRHVSEHFGFLSSKDFGDGPPLPVPMIDETIELGRSRMLRLRESAGVDVGLENLAFAFCADDVVTHPEFLEAIVVPTDGFIVLDLHNLFCQSENFDLDPLELLTRYPTQRVRELHVSGGSVSQIAGQHVRRDTHDHSVPDAVFELLRAALPRFPKLEAVILEQLETALTTEAQQAAYRQDFLRVREIIEEAKP